MIIIKIMRPIDGSDSAWLNWKQEPGSDAVWHQKIQEIIDKLTNGVLVDLGYGRDVQRGIIAYLLMALGESSQYLTPERKNFEKNKLVNLAEDKFQELSRDWSRLSNGDRQIRIQEILQILYKAQNA